MKTATFTNEVGNALGGRLDKLESASLRLQKLTFLGDDSKLEQVKAVCQTARSHGSLPPRLEGDRVLHLCLGGRLMVNMAGGILENAGLCLHPFYNCPMIPGSALKGIARHYAWTQWKEAPPDKKRSLAESIARVFGFPTGDGEWLDPYLDGTPESAGTVVFLPAFPADDTWQLVPDILTPHGGNDYTNPIPNPFPAVEAGTDFRFALRKTNRAADGDLDAAAEWLKQGLCENGAGAKTAAGYGWFDYDEEAQLAREAAEQQAQKEAERAAELKAARDAKIAALTPIQKAALACWETYPEADREGAFKGELAGIQAIDAERQQIVLALCETEGRDVWLAEKREHDRVKDNPKKQKKSKAFKRVSKVLELAQKLGVDLP